MCTSCTCMKIFLLRYKDWFCVSKNKKQTRKHIPCIVNISKIVKSLIFQSLKIFQSNWLHWNFIRVTMWNNCLIFVFEIFLLLLQTPAYKSTYYYSFLNDAIRKTYLVYWLWNHHKYIPCFDINSRQDLKKSQFGFNPISVTLFLYRCNELRSIYKLRKTILMRRI